MRGAGGADLEASEQILFASTLAGAAFNSAGCQIPHALSYPISSLNKFKTWRPKGEGWPIDADKPLIPHGFSVGIPAVAAYDLIAPCNPQRALEVARLLDPDNQHNTRDATPEQAGAALRAAVVALMQVNGMPSGLAELGFTKDEIPAMVEGSFPQKRLLDNAPIDVTREHIQTIFERSMKIWE